MENREQRFAAHGARMLGVRVKEERQERGWTQGDLARRMTNAGYSLHQTTVAKMESGNRPTSVEELFALAAVFGVSVSLLVRYRETDTKLRQELIAAAEMFTRIDDELAEAQQRVNELTQQKQDAQALYHDAHRRLYAETHDE